MKPQTFIRNIDAREYLDIFLVSAAASIVFLRLYLHLTGYPTIGGASYHIAHVLWGGMLMLFAFILNFAFLGRRVQRVIAIVGGVGFGVFIDEVGKFITNDNNYFFRPAVGIIYAIFVVLYLCIRFLTREHKLTDQEYQLNALRQLEEAVRKDMDSQERAVTRHMLGQVKYPDAITKQLRQLLDEVQIVPMTKPGWSTRIRRSLGARYQQLWEKRKSRLYVRLFFVLETVAFLGAVFASLYANIDNVQDFLKGSADYGHSLIIGQLVATVGATVCVLVGLRYLAQARLRSLEWFRTATLVNLLLTEFFLFSRIQFGAVPSFAFNLVMFALLNYVISYEHRLAASD
jgi:hypothetical protein